VLLAALREAKKLDAMFCTFQQRQQFGQLWNGLAGLLDWLVPELDDQVAFGQALGRNIDGNPVVRQPRPTQNHMAGLEWPDPVADKGLARCRGDQVKFVLVMAVPARQRRGVAMVQTTDKTHFGRGLITQRGAAVVVGLQLGLALSVGVGRKGMGK